MWIVNSTVHKLLDISSFVYIYVYIHICRYIDVYMYVYIYTYIYRCIHVCEKLFANEKTEACGD